MTFNPDADRRSAVRPGKRSRPESLLATEVQIGPRWALSIGENPVAISSAELQSVCDNQILAFLLFVPTTNDA